ncbi:MAG: B12-binding domain-containing radical SAM protein [Candidatus Omnitrophota bacterium]
MRLALISPRDSYEIESNNKPWTDDDGVGSDSIVRAGMGTALPLIAALTPDDVEVAIIDENVDVINFDSPFDVVGITAISRQATRAYEIADEFRKRGVYTVMGGIHPSMMPDEAKQHAHTLVIGEAEELWPRFIKDFLNGIRIPFYKDLNAMSVNLAHSPIPRYDLLKKQVYKTIWPQTTRGCPHDCEFCVSSNIYSPIFRHKRISRILKEIEMINHTCENPFIAFADDNMFVNRSFSKELLQELIPLKLSWIAQSDISIGEDEQLLKLLFASGCRAIYTGFESLSEENLNYLDPLNWKLSQLHKYAYLIKKIQSHGIGIHGSFIVGFDKDNEHTFRHIIDFIIDNELLNRTVSILTPYPGSRLRKRLQNEQRLLDVEWSQYNGCHVTFIPKSMTVQELEKGFVKIWRETRREIN